MSRLALSLCLLSALAPTSRAAVSARFSELGLPPSIDRAELESLLQRFVNSSYLKSFRHLGDERDFDHGHLLCDASGKPVAILYHTQELARGRPKGSDFAFLDPDARNWIQWIGDGRLENASRYKRKDYPRTPAWDWFREAELPGLEEHFTILDKMLDPALLPVDVAKTKQWVFTRIPCASAPLSSESKGLRILLPSKEAVCLALAVS